MRQSSKTAIGGMVTALSVVLMFATGIMPFLTYALPALSGILLTYIVIEMSKKWAFGVYVAVSLVSAFIVPDREATMMYIAFFGHYPILKSILETKLPRWLEIIFKLIIFNISVISGYMVLIYMFRLPIEGLNEFGKYTTLIFLVMGNFVFLLYDYALTGLITKYLVRWRAILNMILKW